MRRSPCDSRSAPIRSSWRTENTPGHWQPGSCWDGVGPGAGIGAGAGETRKA